MLGVVVWSKQAALSAVIWCEDHGDIACLKGYGGLAEQPDYLSPDPAPPRWPAVGDLVTLEIVAVGAMRHVRNLAILEVEWGPALPAALKGSAKAMHEAPPDPRPAWRPVTPAFPPAPFAPVPAGQGMMRAPPVKAPPALDQDTPLARVQPRWRRSGLA